MTTDEHKAAGHILVANWGLEVGMRYNFNLKTYKIVELYGDEHCWIEPTSKESGIK